MSVQSINNQAINNHPTGAVSHKEINSTTKKMNQVSSNIPANANKGAPLSKKALRKIKHKAQAVVNKAPRLTGQEVLQKKKQAIVERPDLQNVRIELAKKLNDIDRIDEIVYDYATIVKGKIPNVEDQKVFEQWMQGIAYFLGSPHYDHQLFFKHLSAHPFFSTDKNFKTAFRNFTKKIQGIATPLQRTLNTSKKVKNIAILYPGSGGGGHKAPAQAMAKSLEAQGYKVKLLDVDEFERPYDPKIGGLTRGEIYSKIYQQAGDLPKAFQMWNEGNDAQPLKDRKYMRDLTNTLRDFNTNHLFVVAHHQPEHASLAYQLGVPTTYVHTDNEFHNNLLELNLNQQELAKPLVSFTSLSNEADFHHYLVEREGKQHYNELSPKVREQMVRLDFPVRDSFTKVTKVEKNEIRHTLNIDPNATVVKVAMGANGIGSDIKMILNKIKEEAHLSQKPLHVLVVCGANKALKEELDAENNQHGNAKFEILGFLNEKEMSNFDKASDVWITKPGGSTSAEALAMRKQMLYLPNDHHLWELTNAHRLEKENLAEEFKPWESIIGQINKRAVIGEEVEFAPTNAERWTDQLANIVNRKAVPILALA